MAFGVTPEGFVIKRLPDIKAEIESDLKQVFGVGIDLTAEAPLGQVVGVFAERESLIWELAEDTYNSGYADSAEGISLDNVGALLGIKRKGDTFSTVDAILYGDEGTVIPAGKRASVDGNPSAIFETKTEVTIGAAVPMVQRIAFLFGPPASGAFTIEFDGEITTSLPWNASASDIQVALRALPNISNDLTVSGATTSNVTITFGGDMAGITYPIVDVVSTVATADDDLLFVFPFMLTDGAPPQIPVAMIAILKGPVLAPTGALTVIETAVSGWTSISNPFPAVVGSTRESDPVYRIRRSRILQRSGSGTIEAIRSDILNINGVTYCHVFENEGLDTDDNGLPPKSFRVLVVGGSDQQIADTIWQDKPAGIRSNGTEEINIVDSMGYSHAVQFSRPTGVAIRVQVDITTNADFPDNGIDMVKEFIAAKGNSLANGEDVIATPYLIGALSDIPGITFAEILVDTDTDTFINSVPISVFEIATFDVDDIEVIES